MKLTIESTDHLIDMDGVTCRIWNGTTEGGIKCELFIHRIRAEDDLDHSEFEKELQAKVGPDRIGMVRP